MDNIHNANSTGTPALVPQQAIVMIDDRSLLRDCLSYRLGCEGFRAICLDTIDAIPQNELSTASLVIFYSDSPLDRLSLDVARILEQIETVPLLIISAEDDLGRIIALMKLGVRGYLPNTSTINDVLGAFRLVQSGGTYIPATSLLSKRSLPQMKVADAATRANFTPKQAAIVERIRRGKPNKVIAYELCMCESTVKVHIRNVMRKLNVRNRTELAYKMAEEYA